MLDSVDDDRYVVHIGTVSARYTEATAMTTTTPPCPAMPSPAAQLDLGPFDDVCIREVISRLSVVVGGTLRESVEAAVHADIFGPDETQATAEAKAYLVGNVDAAASALDSLLVLFDAAYPTPSVPAEGF